MPFPLCLSFSKIQSSSPTTSTSLNSCTLTDMHKHTKTDRRTQILIPACFGNPLQKLRELSIWHSSVNLGYSTGLKMPMCTHTYTRMDTQRLTRVGHLTIMKMHMLLLVSDDDGALRWLRKIKEELDAVGKRALGWDRQRFHLVLCPPLHRCD